VSSPENSASARAFFSAFSSNVRPSSITRGESSKSVSDTICNGANDDGSGTVSVIELASALATLKERPKRNRSGDHCCIAPAKLCAV